MKAPTLPIFMLFFAILTASAAPIELGFTADQVDEALGKPLGTIQLREKTLLLYPQGEITLRQGKVTEVDLMSDEQFKADQERLRLEREEWLIDQQRREVARKEEGEALRDGKLKSRAFAALSAKDKVDYWRSFQVRYPGVDVAPQIASSLEGYETELEALRKQQRMAELETRVAQAEKEAAAAKLQTEELRREAEEKERKRQQGIRSYRDPYVRNYPYYYRPPTITIYSNDHKKDDKCEMPKEEVHTGKLPKKVFHSWKK